MSHPFQDTVLYNMFCFIKAGVASSSLLRKLSRRFHFTLLYTALFHTGQSGTLIFSRLRHPHPILNLFAGNWPGSFAKGKGGDPILSRKWLRHPHLTAYLFQGGAPGWPSHCTVLWILLHRWSWCPHLFQGSDVGILISFCIYFTCFCCTEVE